MKKKTFDFHIFVMRLAAVLLSLVMLTSGMVSGRYARYVTSATGSDSARVAKFSVTQQSIQHRGQEKTRSASIPMPEILPGESEIVDILVEYDTEVSIRNIISVTNKYENLPLTINVGEKGGTASGSTFEGVYPSGHYTKEYEVTITWPKDSNSQNYIGMVDLIEIAVTTEQVD